MKHEEARSLITLIVIAYNLNFHERIYFKSHYSCLKVLEENYFPMYKMILQCWFVMPSKRNFIDTCFPIKTMIGLFFKTFTSVIIDSSTRGCNMGFYILKTMRIWKLYGTGEMSPPAVNLQCFVQMHNWETKLKWAKPIRYHSFRKH